MDRPSFNPIKKLIGLFFVIFFLAVFGKGLTTEKYFCEGERSISEDLFSLGTSALKRSWGETFIDGNSNVVESGSGLNTIVNFGKDFDSNEIKWWIADKNEEYMTLYATEPVEYGNFNTYLEGLDKRGNYSQIEANNWVTSAARAFFGRNQGDYPGNIDTRTGVWDSTSEGNKSPFEEKYFTDEMLLKINPKNIITYNYKGEEFSSKDRFWLPLLVGGNSLEKNVLSLRPDSKLNYEDLNSDKLLVPSKYLKGKNIWTRRVSGENILCYENLKEKEVLVTETRGYNPVMQMSLKGISFVSVFQAEKSSSDGIFKHLDEDKRRNYYLKYGPVGSAYVKQEEDMRVSSSMKVSFYLEEESAYLSALLFNKNTSEVFCASKYIEKSNNGETYLDLSEVAAGNYEIKLWIEIPEEGDRGICRVSEVVSFSLLRGYEVKFEKAENIRFFSKNNEELTEKSIILDKGEVLEYCANVDENYNMSQIRTTLAKSDSGDVGVTLNPVGVSSAEDTENDLVEPLTVGGAIITEGFDNVVYELRAQKNYWYYQISDLESDVKVLTTGAEEENMYYIFVSTDMKKFIDSFSINGNQVDLTSDPSQLYSTEENINLEFVPKDEYDLSDLALKIVPSSWVEQLEEDGSEYDSVKESCREKFEEMDKTEFIKGDDNKYTYSNFSLKDFNSDVYIFAEGFRIKKYIVSFKGSGEISDIFDVGKMCVVKDGQETQISQAGYEFEYGKTSELRYYLDERYEAENSVLTLEDGDRTFTAMSQELDDETGRTRFDWTNFTAVSDSTIAIKTINKKADLEVKFSTEGFDFDDIFDIEVESESGTKDTVYYGCNYKFKVTPKDGYRWSSDSGVNVNIFGAGECTSIADGDSYNVVIRSNDGQGLREDLEIKLTGIEEVSEEEKKYTVTFKNETSSQIRLYQAVESGFYRTRQASENANITVDKAFSFDPTSSSAKSTDSIVFDKDKTNSSIVENGENYDINFSFYAQQDINLSDVDTQFQDLTQEKGTIECKDVKFEFSSPSVTLHKEETETTIELSLNEVSCSGTLKTSSGEYQGKFTFSSSDTVSLKVNVTWDSSSYKIDSVTLEDLEQVKSTSSTINYSIKEVAFTPDSLDSLDNFSIDLETEEKSDYVTLPEAFSSTIPEVSVDESKGPVVKGEVSTKLNLKQQVEKIKLNFKKDICLKNSDLELDFDLDTTATAESLEKTVTKPYEISWMFNGYTSLIDSDQTKRVYRGKVAFDDTVEYKFKIDIDETVIDNEQKFTEENSEKAAIYKLKLVDSSDESEQDDGFYVTVSVHYKQVVVIDFNLKVDQDQNQAEYLGTVAPTVSKSDDSVGSVEFKSIGLSGEECVSAEVYRVVERGKAISNLDDQGQIDGENQLIFDLSGDEIIANGETIEKNEMLIWADRTDLASVMGDSTALAKIFSGDIEIQTDYEIQGNDSNKALDNIFKISEVSSDAEILILKDSRKLVRIQGDSDIKLADAVKIYKTSGSSTSEIDTEDSTGLIFNQNDELSIKISEKEGYDISDVEVKYKKGDEAETTANKTDDTWSIGTVDDDIDIVIYGVSFSKVKFEYPQIEGLEIYDLWDSSKEDKSGKEEKVEIGGSKSIVIRQSQENAEKKQFTDTKDYNFLTLTDSKSAKITNIADFSDGELIGYTVTVSNISLDTSFSVANSELLPSTRTYDVILNYPSTIVFNCFVNDIAVQNVSSEKITVSCGDTVKFTVNEMPGYSHESINVKSDSEDIEETTEEIDGEEQKVYVLKDIKGDRGVLITVQGELSRVKHYVKFDWLNTGSSNVGLLEDAITVEMQGRDDNFVNCGVPVYYGEDVKFYITVSENYSKSVDNMKITVESGDIQLSEISSESNLSKRKYAYKTVSGVTSDVDLKIDGLEKNVVILRFASEDAKVKSLDDDQDITDGQQKLGQGDSFKFYVEVPDNYEISSIEAIKSSSTGSYISYNKISEIDESEASGKQNAYIIENLYGDIIIQIEVKIITHVISFAEGEKGSLTGDDIDADKFKVKSVKGTEAQKIDEYSIKAPHGEIVNITFEFTKRFDKFDGGKTSGGTSGVGSITLEDLSNGDTLKNFIRDSDSNELQITGVFYGENTVKLENFEVNEYEIEFPEEREGYALYTAEKDQSSGVDSFVVGSEMASSDLGTVKDSETYAFFVKSMDGGFDYEASVVTAVSSDGTRETLEPYEDKDGYLLYTIKKVYRDISIEIEAKRQKFEVRHEGYKCSFFYLGYNGSEDVLYPLENNKTPSGVEAGESWTFYVKADTGYDITNSTAISSAGNTVSDKGIVTGIPEWTDSGVSQDKTSFSYKKFTVDSVNMDTTVLVSNVSTKEYKIEFELDSSLEISESINDILSIYDENGNEFSFDTGTKRLYGSAQHFSRFKFKTIFADIYNKNTPSFEITVDNQDISSDDLGTIERDDSDEYWEIKEETINKGYDLVIKIGNVGINQYSVSFVGKGVNFDDSKGNPISVWDEQTQKQVMTENTQTIQHLTGELVFRVRENKSDGYTIDDGIEVTAKNGNIMSNYSEGTSSGEKYREYTLKNVTADTIITVDGAKSVYYTIDFKTDLNGSADATSDPPVGLKILDTEGKDISTGIRTTNASNVKFAVVLDSQYSRLSPSVYINWGQDGQEELTEVDGYYEIKNVKKDETVMIRELSGNYNSYELKIVENTDYEKVDFLDSNWQVIQSAKITHGGSYNFKIRPKDGYRVSQATVKATNCDMTYSRDSTDSESLDVNLSNVIDDPEVTVSDVSLKIYTVDFSFTLTDGSATDSEAAKIYAYGSDRDITSGTSVNYQKDLKFRITLGEGYSNSTVTVKYKNTDGTGAEKQVNASAGYYKIENIMSDITIDIGNLSKNKYSVRLVMSDSEAANVKIYHNDQEVSPNVVISDAVEYGGSYEFRIETLAGYNLDKLTVTTKDADVSVSSTTTTEADVVLSNIKGNLSAVNISGINEDQFTISFPDIENITVYDENSKDVTITGKGVSYQNSAKFTMEPNEGYDQYKDSWVVKYTTKDENGDDVEGELVATTDSDGTKYWTVSNIIADVEVRVSGVDPNQYKVNLSGNRVTFLAPAAEYELTDSDKWITYGGSFMFRARANTGYDFTNMSISSDTGILVEESKTEKEAIYTLSNVKKEVTVSIRIDKSKISVNLIEATGVTYHDTDTISEIVGEQTITYGNSFEFAVRVSKEYDISTLVVKLGNEVLEPYEGTSDYQKFKTGELSADYQITASVEKKSYTVKLPYVEGLTFYENSEEIDVSEEIVVSYGDSFQFEIELDEKHDQSTASVKYNVEKEQNGETVTVSTVLDEINGYYTVTEISSNIEIVVEDVNINRYKINLTEASGIEYRGGENLDEEIKGIYVVEYGGEFEFKVVALEGYTLSGMTVVVQDEDGTTTSLLPSEEVYTVYNVKGNKTIKVSDQSVIQYQVLFEATDGVTYMNSVGNTITDAVTVKHGNDFEFSITIASAYDESTPLIETTSSRSQISKLATGKYILTNVTEDMTIKINNVSRNKYTVTLKPVTGIIYKDLNGNTLDSEQLVEHEMNLSFKIDYYQAYSESSITVMMGKEKLKAGDDGSYLIESITENKTVTVTGVEENPEVKLINMIDALSSTISNASDVDAVVEATLVYNQLSDEAKTRVTNLEKLTKLQNESGDFIHTTNDITVEGVDWYIKLVAVPLSTSSDEMGRIYENLDTEFVLSLYNIYLWDMLEEKKYTLSDGQKVKVSIPTPDLTYFKDTFIVHEKSSDGKLEYILLTIDGDRTYFDMSSFSPVGMAAKRKVDSVHSSFFDTVGANVSEMRKIISSAFKKRSSSSSSDDSETSEGSSTSSKTLGLLSSVSDSFKNSSEEFDIWSILRLFAVLVIGFTISITVTLIVNKKNSKKKSNKFEILDEDDIDLENEEAEDTEITDNKVENSKSLKNENENEGELNEEFKNQEEIENEQDDKN